MKAIVQRQYGSPDQLTFEERPEPAIGQEEVLVRVRAASVHPDVWHVVRGQPYVLRIMGAGVRRPTTLIPGTDMAGIVEAVGERVTQFAPGDEVFGETIRDMYWINGGAYAEYASAPRDSLAMKPPGVTFEEAAAVPTSGLIAHQAIHYQGQVESGWTVLVNGAGGGVGTFAVQLAKAYGAEVTGVDDTEKQGMIESIGADHVLDYREEDVTRQNTRYDLVVDIAGNHSFAAWKRILEPDGRYILIGHDHYGEVGRRFLGSIPRALKLMVLSPFVDELAGMGFSTPPKRESLATLRGFLISGELTPIVDRTYPLSEVPRAIQYLESGRVQGKVVISVQSGA